MKARITALLGVCLAMGAAGCNNRMINDPLACNTSLDCDQRDVTKGQICMASLRSSGFTVCKACLADEECQKVPYYGVGSACQDGRCRSVCGAAGCQSSACSDIGCGRHQLCTQASTSQGSSCLDSCEEGYAWNARLRSCDAVNPACVAAGCSTKHRDCSVQGSAAVCTSCLAGFVEVSGICTLAQSCTSLGCEGQRRSCVTDPTARCAGCKAGFLEDPATHQCRAVRKCADTQCGQLCQEAMDHADATCIQSCPAAQAINPTTHQCESCGEMAACNKEGETGELEPVKTFTYHCACKTKPGYFFWDAAGGGTTRCDADGDGWLKNAARMAVENVARDPAIRDTMKCGVHQIGSVVLESRGEGDLTPPGQLEVYLSGMLGIDSLVLYEADELDDDNRLLSLGLPKYGDRTLKAAELNGLAKYCVDARADFNQNGKSDVLEYDGEVVAGRDSPEDKLKADFAYFGELFRSWYEPGANGAPGKLHIREKQRARTAPADDRVGPTYVATAGAYWQSCERKSEKTSGGSSSVTMDFAGTDYIGTSFSGLNHYSQFKCVVVSSDTSAKLPAVSASSFGTAYQFNQCRATGTSTPVLGDKNPLDPEVSCTAVGTPAANSVGWASVLFQPGSTNVRGCLDECTSMAVLPPSAWCPGFIDGVPNAGESCKPDSSNFGLRSCGCGDNFGGAACDIPCLSEGVHKSTNFDSIHRKGMWMCGTASETTASTDPKGRYVLKGRIQAQQVSRPGLSGGGYSLH